MRLAIADPPYPPLIRADGSRLTRAARWYGNAAVARSDRPADCHAAAAEWDDYARHRQLLEDLVREYDGWAIATAPDGLAAYHPLPNGSRVMAWIRPSSQPGSHRILSRWEPVIVFPPLGRRSNRGGAGCVPDALFAAAPGTFVGAKPREWTTWILDALSFNADTDTVDDLFPGSGSVGASIAQLRLATAGA